MLGVGVGLRDLKFLVTVNLFGQGIALVLIIQVGLEDLKFEFFCHDKSLWAGNLVGFNS
jgi:hypothetical protein